MLNADDLAAFQADKLVLETANQVTMTVSVVIQSPTHAQNGAGGHTVTWTNIATVVGRISEVNPDNAEEMRLANSRPGTEKLKITLPRGTSVQTGYRLTSAGRTFEVLGVVGMLTWEVGTKVIVVEHGG